MRTLNKICALEDLKPTLNESERLFPRVEEGAICRGEYLKNRGYLSLGIHWLFKRESNGSLYLFELMDATNIPATTRVSTNAIYRLKAKS